MKYQRGATLVELSIFIAAALVLLAIGLTAWSKVQASTKSTRLISMVSTIDQAIRSRYTNAWSYTGLSVDAITDALPGDMRPDPACKESCVILSPFGGDIVVGPSFPGGTFAITIGAPLPTDACIDLVTQLGTQYWYVQRGTSMKSKSFAAIDPATALAGCSNRVGLRLVGS